MSRPSHCMFGAMTGSEADTYQLVMDEFYGGYNYTNDCDGTTISAAANVEDVDEDDVLILDGLTKRFRLPGWRIAWILGPKVAPTTHPAAWMGN